MTKTTPADHAFQLSANNLSKAKWKYSWMICACLGLRPHPPPIGFANNGLFRPQAPGRGPPPSAPPCESSAGGPAGWQTSGNTCRTSPEGQGAGPGLHKKAGGDEMDPQPKRWRGGMHLSGGNSFGAKGGKETLDPPPPINTQRVSRVPAQP